MSKYIWARGSHISNKTADPQVVGDELDQLQQQNGGRLTPRIVVDAARPVSSALHPIFEWDDLRAAELYREDQARHVVNSIRIMQAAENPRHAARVIHAYVSLVEQVGDEKERAYVPLARVMADDTLLAQAIERAAAELRSFEDRYQEFDLIARAARSAREELEKATTKAA